MDNMTTPLAVAAASESLFPSPFLVAQSTRMRAPLELVTPVALPVSGARLSRRPLLPKGWYSLLQAVQEPARQDRHARCGAGQLKRRWE